MNISRQKMEHVNAKELSIKGVKVTATAAELNIMDGVTATAAELSKLAGSGANVTAANLAALTGGANTALHKHVLANGASDVTATAAEVNKLAGSGANVTAVNLAALTGGGNIAAAAGGHGHLLAAGATDVTATATQINTLARHPGTQGYAVIDFNTGAAEAACSITVGGVVYLEADAEDLPNGVWTNGASAAESAASFLAAVNGDTRSGGSLFTAVASAAGESVILVADAVGTAGNAVITTDSAARVTVENAHGGTAAALKQLAMVTQIVTAQDILAGEVTIPLPWAPTAWSVQYTDTTGGLQPTTWLATVQTAPNRIRIADNGATALIAGDVVHIVAMS